MKIIEVSDLAIPEVKVIRFQRFIDNRGYFSETFRKSDLFNDTVKGFTGNDNFNQANESFSHKGTFRGLHFQWNPHMGKLVRPLAGQLIDFALDIRKNSPTLGKIVAYEIKSNLEGQHGEWIWIPPGFAHGILLPEDSLVEYFCTGEYSSLCEACISPLAEDIDWSICNTKLKKIFDDIVFKSEYISEKDRNGFSLKTWLGDERSSNFIYKEN